MSTGWVHVGVIVIVNLVALWLLKRWTAACIMREAERLARREDVERLESSLRPRPVSVPPAPEFTRMFEPQPAPAPPASGDFTGVVGTPRAPAPPAPPPPPSAPAPTLPTPPPAFPQTSTTAPTWAEVQVFFATDRRPSGNTAPAEFFTGERSPAGAMTYGQCIVTIPRDHKMGALEAPCFLKLQFRPQPEKHVVLKALETESKEDFFEAVARRSLREAFVFIHGYNVTFEDAARRTGQIAYDLGFAGVPVLYSWPSEGSPHRYSTDEANVEWSNLHFRDFLKDLAAVSGLTTIHIIAHSMGNRLLTAALHHLVNERFTPPARFRQVVLAAPDIDADTLRQLAGAIKDTAERITLYASASDKALILSRRFHRYPRAGEYVFPIPGIDLIDASAVDTSLMGHSYYGDNRSVLSDLFWLLRKGDPPSQRFGMSELTRPDGTYFAFLP